MELPEYLTVSCIENIEDDKLTLSEVALSRIRKNRAYLEQILAGGRTYYGINTGFGSLCNVRIESDELSQLQENLVCSHACGMGDEVPADIVKLMLMLKVHGVSRGYSGVRTEKVRRLMDFYNLGILPVVYELGSLGASGDLAPLAHMSLPLLGKGWVRYQGKKMASAEALGMVGLNPISLAAKEGLALLNGTQFMSAYCVWALMVSRKLMVWADVIGALSADVFLAKDEPFKAPIHRVRPHKGQVASAARILNLLQESELQQEAKEQVQDPYSFRCMPQVHGATADVIHTVLGVVETEINSVTDNPIIFDDEDAIMSGGNFHGQPLALHADFLAIAMAELANISERRTYLLLSGQRGLSPFLSPHPGLNSGFMITQYTAAGIVSQNKQYCTPASVDSIISSNGQEDHVSMGANAVTKLRRVIMNVQRVLAIELLSAAQALDLRRPLQTSPKLEKVYNAFRKEVAFMAHDEILHERLVLAERFLDRNAEEIMQ